VYDKSDLNPQKLISRFDIEGIDVRVINIRLSNKHGLAFRILTFAAYALIATWYALILPADVVVSSSGPISVGLPGMIAFYLRRVPFVFEVRDLWPEGAIQLGILRNGVAIRLARYFEKRCYQAASKVVTLSEGMAQWIGREHGIDKLEVVPNASDNELIERLDGNWQLPAWALEKKLALYTGTLGLIDDCGQLLELARVLQQCEAHDIEIGVIGDGKERAMLEKKARAEQLLNIHFLGLMSKEDVMRWLKLASCSLLVVKDVPFLATASPNKLFDAFAAGVPVVQSTQGWMKNLLDREQCGITTPPNNPEAMARAVMQLARDVQFRELLATNARRVARDLFDRSLLAGKMREVLASAVQVKVANPIAVEQYP
jgi:glycosyltransferase involved in cell wall biosynthesis